MDKLQHGYEWLFDKIFGVAYQNIWGLDVTGIHDSIQYTIYPAENEEQCYQSHRDGGTRNMVEKSKYDYSTIRTR